MKHTVTLRNGVQVPALGLGTWFLGENKAARAREESTECFERFEIFKMSRISGGKNDDQRGYCKDRK